MKKWTCEFCGDEFKPTWFDQRFCCRAHSDAFHTADRKDAVAFFRAQGLRPRVPATMKEAAE
jgi:hypothetical protein